MGFVCTNLIKTHGVATCICYINKNIFRKNAELFKTEKAIRYNFCLFQVCHSKYNMIIHVSFPIYMVP